jgi:hypothetical protein
MPKTYYDPDTGNPVDQAEPPSAPKQYYNPETGNPVGQSNPQLPPDTGQDAFNAGVHSKMLDVTPGYAYQNREEITKQLKATSTDYDGKDVDPSFYNDLAVGLEGSISGLEGTGKLPDKLKNPGRIDQFIKGIGQLIGDLPTMVVGGVVGTAVGGAAGSEVPIAGNITGAGVGAAAGAFALPAAMREGLVEGIKNGGVKSIGDVLRRAAAITWAGAKGAVTGAATELSGGIPVAGFLAKSPLGAMAVKGLYQASAMTTAADLLEGKVPTAEDFTGNAALIVPLNLITHGLAMSHGETKQAAMDVYAKDGTVSQETTQKLNAQPPVKSDLPEGLRPSIQVGEGVVEGDENESHANLSQRVLAQKPVTMEQLEAEPAKADDVLEQPKIQDQDVIDRAWQLKSEAIDAGEVSQPGMTTLYRGEAVPGSGKGVPEWVKESDDYKQQQVAQGRWFTSDPKEAEAYATDYANEGTQTRITKIQVPTSEIDKYRASNDPEASKYVHNTKRDQLNDEFFVPREIADKASDKPLTIDDLYDRAAMKSGRGFTTPDGQFLSRMEARKWMKDNEPDVHDMWTNVSGDKSAELHSQDYAEARNRVQNRNVAEGDPQVSAMSPDLTRALAENRSGILNKVKAGMASKKYGYEAIRTLLVGPRNMFRAAGEQVVSRIRKIVPDELNQEALHFARDYRDDPAGLRSAIEEVRSGDNEKLKAYIPAMERALEPMTPEMQQADSLMTEYFKKQLDLGRQTGTLDSGVDPSRYSPRFFARATEDGQTGGVGRPRFTDKTVNSIRRDYLHTLDPLKSGDTEARTFNAVDEMSIYNDRMAVANSTAIFKTELKNSALGVEGSREKAPDGWVPLSHQFEDRRTFVQDDGSSVTTVKNFYVPKDIAEALKPLLEAPGQMAQVTKFLHIQSVVKGIELTLSAFHIKALNITAFNNMGLNDFVGSINSDNASPDFETIESRGALYGLETTKTSIPFEAYRGLKPEVVPTGLARLNDNAVVNAADATAKAITKYTFDVVQRKWKVMDFAKKEAGWIAKNPNATESEYGDAMRGYAKQVNSAYGGLNWDVMGVSRGTQNVSRLFLLAPDWTFSNVANLKYALSDSGTAGSASRGFLLKSFTTGFAMTAAASIFIGGSYDPSDVKHLDQVYMGEDKDGKKMYANWFFAGAPKDTMNLIKRSYSEGAPAGIAETILSKASPVLGTVVDVAKNKDFKGAPIYRAKDNNLEKSGKTLLYGAEKLVPITGESAVETVTRALTDPNHEFSYKDILDIVADALGSPTYHEGKGNKGGTSKSSGPLSSKTRKASNPLGKSKFSIRSGR